jgi:hypothetical protein
MNTRIAFVVVTFWSMEFAAMPDFRSALSRHQRRLHRAMKTLWYFTHGQLVRDDFSVLAMRNFRIVK